MKTTLTQKQSFILSSTNGVFGESDLPLLLNQVEVHKYLINQNIPWTITDDDAIFSWLENVFNPIMLVAHQWNVQASFPYMSDSQLFFAISDHWYYLLSKNEKISAQAAAINYAATYGKGLGQFISKVSNPIRVA